MGLYFITAPAMAFAFVESREMITLLGSKWITAVPIFRAMTICTLAGSAMQVSRWVYLAEGSTKRLLNWSLISTPVMLVGVVAGLPWGATGVAWGFTAAVCALASPSLQYCFKGSTLKLPDFVQAVWRPLLAAVLTAVMLIGLRHLATEIPSLITGLVRDACFMAVMYAGFWLATRGGRDDLREMLALLRHLRSMKTKPL
jgi:PST family polysaccharide transporter